MKIQLSSKTLQHFPGISYTVILIKNVKNQRKISSLSQLLRGQAVVAKNELKKADKRDLFERVTSPALEDGSTFLESYLLASQVKKIQNGKDIEGKNNLINFINLVSLKYFLPLHGFDLDQAEQDYLLSLYLPKKGKKAPDLDFLPETKHLVIWFPNLAGLQDEQIDHLIGEINALLYKYLQSQITEVYHLSDEHPEVDLGYVSDKEVEFQKKKAEMPEAATPEITGEPEILDVPLYIVAAAGAPAGAPAGEPEISDMELSPLPLTEVENPAPTRPDSAKQQLIELISSALNSVYAEKIQQSGKTAQELVEVEYPKDHTHGDFATNIAMKLTKLVGESPQQIAEKIRQTINNNTTSKAKKILDSIEIVAPGFINFRLTLEHFKMELAHILQAKEHYGRSEIGANKHVMIEFGSLNMAKPFGAHHFLTTIIGQTLVNLYKVTGHQVLSADFPGDWGTQFGKTLYALKHWGERQVIEKDPMNELLKLYVRFHEEAENDKSLEDDARAEFQKLEAGDSQNLELWKWIIEVSQRDLDTIYKTLGVHHDCRFPESRYNQTYLELLEKGKQLGVFQEGTKGAFVVNFEAEKLPTAIVQKGDGTSLYITRDLASIKDRLTEYPQLSKMVYVVDVAQSLHFQQLFVTARRLHLADPTFPITEFKHVVYGRMSFADSSMSTRKGNIILGTDLIKEALTRAENLVQEKSTSLTATEQKQIAHGIALGAIKYAMIAQAPESDFTFDWDKVLSFDGNSAPYLQYTQARANSILKKSHQESSASANQESSSADQISLFSIDEVKQEEKQSIAEASLSPFSDPHELALLKSLTLFPGKIALAAHSYKPNILTTYLHDLAQTFNSFYGAVPVLKTKNPDLLKARLQLVEATAQLLKNGLNLVGIATFERM